MDFIRAFMMPMLTLLWIIVLVIILVNDDAPIYDKVKRDLDSEVKEMYNSNKKVKHG